MSVVILEQAIVHYEVLGRGRPVLFLHGWVGGWRYWIPAMQSASTGYRAYALDLWGFGDTAKVSARYGLAQQAELLNAFLEKMGIGQIAIVGHGLGSLLALLLANMSREVVERVMLTGYPLDEAIVLPRLRAVPPAENVDWLLGRSPQADSVRLDALKADPQAVAVSLRDFSNNGMRALWKSIRVPCLMVHGQNDPLVPLPRPEQVAALPAMAHLVVFENSGHYPMLDESSKFNRLLADFLMLEPGDSPRELQLKDEWKRRIR